MPHQYETQRWPHDGHQAVFYLPGPASTLTSDISAILGSLQCPSQPRIHSGLLVAVAKSLPVIRLSLPDINSGGNSTTKNSTALPWVDEIARETHHFAFPLQILPSNSRSLDVCFYGLRSSWISADKRSKTPYFSGMRLLQEEEDQV